MADIRAECGVCGHVQLQRFFHATELHSATSRTLRHLAESVAAKTGFECPNCGSSVEQAHACNTAMTWGFADDAGTVRAVDDDPQKSSLAWELRPNIRLDPQALPLWQVEQPSATLSEALVLERLGRPVSVKSYVREVLADWTTSESPSVQAQICTHAWLVADETSSLDGHLDALRADVDAGDLLAIRFDDAVPHKLATHREPATMPGAFDEWMPAVPRAQVAMLVDTAPIQAVVERAFQIANITADRQESGWHEITTPRGSAYPRALSIESIARRAVYTGLTPGDAARLSAEEIVGTLLRVW